MRRGRIAEPSSWGGIGGVALAFAVSPQSVMQGIGDIAIPWQLRLGALVVAVVCFAIQFAMREFPNK